MSVYPVNELSLSAEHHPFPLVIVLSRGSAAIEPHHHPFYEISLYTSGAAVEVVSGVRSPASRGTLVCKPPHHIHHTISEPGREYAKYSVMFDIDALLDSRYDQPLRQSYELADDRRQTYFFHLPEDGAAHLESLVRELYGLSRADPRPAYNEALQKAKLTEILAQAAAVMRPDAKAASRRTAAARASASAGRPRIGTAAVEYIHRRFLEELTLQSLADRFKVSAPYMSAVVKKTTGHNFVDYVQSLRIEHAGSLLRSGSMSVMDVAAESGFNSYKTFARAFRKWKGTTPAEYRRRL